MTGFHAVPQRVRARLVEAAGAPRPFRDGAYIQGRADPQAGFCMIETGAVRFANTAADGALADLAELAAGDCFGEIPLLSGRAPAYDAYARGTSTLLIVPAARFAQLVEGEGEVAAAFARLLAGRLHDVFAVLDDLRLLRPLPRAAKYLLWTTGAGAREAGELRIDQARLASRLGVSRVTLGRALSVFARAGAVKLGYRRITVVDREALARFVDAD